jgi:anti-sigma factor RsiW
MIADWRCRRMTPRLVDLADGALPAAHRDRVERHVAACAACREALHALRDAPAKLRALGDQTGPEVDWERQRRDIMRAVRTVPEPAGRRVSSGFDWRLAMPVAAMAVIAIAGVAVLRKPNSHIRASAERAGIAAPELADFAEVVLPFDELLEFDVMPEGTALGLVDGGWAGEVGDAVPRELDDFSDREIEELAGLMG